MHFSFRDPSMSVDLALFVNGLPVATVELKNPNTGQNVDHAIAQYRDRDPNELFFAKRTVVHFAVDPDRAFITTRLKGRDTEFLPFNIGSNGAGRAGGAGNPRPVRDIDYAVSYLWEEIWQRDNWLELLQRFVHVQASDRKTGKVNPHTSPRIFPRFHQWHAVRKMVTDAREHGAGRNYLVEHSAGSGKSNTIAWLAHRLSNLFDDDNQPVFHKVIVITDRLVLDRQLQRTIFQFDHTPGVVKKIDEDSAQLAAALEDATSKVIISTMQKYPFVLDKIADAGLGSQRYAVIIDEAHSSQGGDAATRLKQALGANAAPMEDDEDAAEYMTRVRGPQPNLSYFAFTATPKSPTLKLFGTLDPDKVNPRTGEHGHARAVPRLLDAAGDRGGLHPRRARQLHHLRHQMAAAERRRRAGRIRAGESGGGRAEGQGEARPVRRAAPDVAAAEGEADRRGLPGQHGRAARRAGEGHGRHTGRQHALELYQAIRKLDDDCPAAASACSSRSPGR